MRSADEQGNAFSALEKHECKLHDGEILNVEVIPSMPDNDHSVLINYSNGGVEFVSGDLSNSHWLDPSASGQNNDYGVEHATLVDVDSARKGILKSREDIVALLDHTQATEPSTSLLCRVIRSNSARRVELHTIRDPLRNALQTSRSPLQLLTTYELPSIAHSKTQNVQYELHEEFGMLYQLLAGTLSLFDLSGTIPRKALELGGPANPIQSFTRVSSNSIVTFSNGSATLFETSFGSVRGSVSLKSIESAAKVRKRRRDRTRGSLSLCAISAFTDIGLVSALAGDEIVAFQVEQESKAGRRSKSRATLLSSVVGRGNNRSLRAENVDGEEHWQDWKAKVDAMIADRDIEGLERLVANDKNLGRQRKRKRKHRAFDGGDMQNEDVGVYEELWPLPESFDPSKLDRRKALYILGCMFIQSSGEAGGLNFRLESAKLLEWLALTGFLTIPEIQKAWETNPRKGAIFNEVSRPGAIMTAIRAIDGDFHVMRDLLSLPVHWEIAEIVQALRLVIQSFDVPPTEDRILALPAPPTANGNKDLTNGDVDDGFENESKNVEKELDLAMNTLSTGLEVRSDTVQEITKRLHAFAPTTITATMREMMSPSEIVFFIHILRIELADGGWTSQYVDVGGGQPESGLVNTIGAEDERGQPSDEAIKAIGSLLNCAVDAIGTSGWLVGQTSSMNGGDGLIDVLRAEVSAGLEGCYEASTLQTLLAEIQKCETVPEMATTQSRALAITDGDLLGLEKSLLPMTSMAGSQGWSRRNEKDGKKRSKMAVGREKSKRVGKYSFERIRI